MLYNVGSSQVSLSGCEHLLALSCGRTLSCCAMEKSLPRIPSSSPISATMKSHSITRVLYEFPLLLTTSCRVSADPLLDRWMAARINSVLYNVSSSQVPLSGCKHLLALSCGRTLSCCAMEKSLPRIPTLLLESPGSLPASSVLSTRVPVPLPSTVVPSTWPVRPLVDPTLSISERRGSTTWTKYRPGS